MGAARKALWYFFWKKKKIVSMVVDFEMQRFAVIYEAPQRHTQKDVFIVRLIYTELW